MIQGIFYALLAGTLISAQNVFLTRTGEKFGFWETATLVHGLGLVAGLIILLIMGRSAESNIREVNIIYIIGCTIGIFVVFTVVQGVARLGVVYAVPLIIGAQIIGSVVISRFGLFEEKIVTPNLTNIAGILLLMAGAVLTQIR